MILGSMAQVPQYPFNQPQVNTISGNLPCLQPPAYMQLDQGSFKEGKVLGAMQILIGLIHIGLGSILGTVIFVYYTSISFSGGYPFWAGIWFIISGSLSVASEHLPRSSLLLKGSLGLNIISAICSMVGIMLCITELIINPLYYYRTDYYFYRSRVPGVVTSAVLLLFSLLEFCIACTAAFFGCQLLRHPHNSGPMVLQNVHTNPEPANTPPSYSTVGQGFQ